MKRVLYYILISIITLVVVGSCATDNKQKDQKEDSSIVTKRHVDGTLSSVIPVAEEGYLFRSM